MNKILRTVISSFSGVKGRQSGALKCGCVIWKTKVTLQSQGSLLSVTWQPGWEGVCVRICMAESLCCPPETVTALLIDSTPIQNKKIFKNVTEI